MTEDCILIFDPKEKKSSLNEKAMELDKRYQDVTLASAQFLLGDAVEGKMKVFRLTKPIKPKGSLPTFKSV